MYLPTYLTNTCNSNSIILLCITECKDLSRYMTLFFWRVGAQAGARARARIIDFTLGKK